MLKHCRAPIHDRTFQRKVHVMLEAHPIPTGRDFKNLTGRFFGRWEVLQYAGNRNGNQLWLCKCRCALRTKRPVQGGDLASGKSLSCGCLQREMAPFLSRTHGCTADKKCTRAFRAWAAMMQRCTDKRGVHYDRYGGRGIRVCRRWKKFVNFLADMGEPSKGLTLDRRDNNGDYCKANCRWATMKAQARNRSSNHLVTFEGKTQCIAAWADEVGMRFGTLASRLARGWPVWKALTKPA